MTLYNLESALQSSSWAEFQRCLGKRYWQLSGPGWKALCIQEKRSIGSYLYSPYGPICDDLSGLNKALTAIKQLAKEIRPWWIRIEPRPYTLDTTDTSIYYAWKEILNAAGFRKAQKDHQPRYSRLIDLGQPESEIISSMTGSNRSIYRNHANKGLEVRSSKNPQDTRILSNFLSEMSEDNGIVSRTSDYILKAAETLMPRGAATLYSTWKDDHALCAALVYDTPSQRLFAHAAMPRRNRGLRPNQPLISTALIDAHRSGQVTADLFGMAPPEQINHPWSGFSNFKRSFGGEDVAHLGTWERPVLPGALHMIGAQNNFLETRAKVMRSIRSRY